MTARVAAVRAGQLAALAAAGALAGLATAAVLAGAVDRKTALAILLATLVPAPIYVRVAQRRFDPFEPIQIIAVAFMVLFVMRPIAELVWGIDSFANLYTRPGFEGAAAISLVGCLSVYLGYAAGAGRHLARILPGPVAGWDRDKSVRFATGLLGLSALLTAAFAATVGPGALLHFYLGRTATDYQTYLMSNAYVALGPYLTIPTTFIVLLAFLRRRTLGAGVLLAICVLAALYLTVPRGDRTYILAFTLPFIVLWYLRHDRRPSGVSIVVALVLGILALNVLLALRHVETRAQRGIGTTVVTTFTNPLASVKTFATGVDLGEFSVLELEWQAMHRPDNRLHEHPGATLRSLVVGPIPRKLIGTKPKSGLEFTTDHIFPVNVRRASFGPSMYGDMFADWGWITLVLVSLCVGIGARTLWEFFLRHGHNEGVQILFAATLPLLVIMSRDSVPFIIARSVFLALPLLVCLVVCSRPRRRRFSPYGAPAGGSSPATPARSASR